MKKYKQQDISSGVIKCVSCEGIKSLDNFYFRRGYYNYLCKGCHKEKHKKNYIKVEKVNVFSFIVCNKCGVEKPVGDYLKRSNGYYIKRCKECRYVKSTKIKPQRNDGYKTCCKCKLDLPTTEYYTSNGNPKGPCKKCKVIINKDNHKKWINTEYGKLKSRENNKKYISKLKELNPHNIDEKKRVKGLLMADKENKRLERDSKKVEILNKKLENKRLRDYRNSDEWKQIKKQKEKERQYNKWKRRWNEDEMFAMKVRLRNLIRNSFRRVGYKKFNISTEQIVGLKYGEFKKYLESIFLDGMSWDNRGEWHIDHIIPLSSAKSETELISLCHYSNLQPLWGNDNMKKGNKIL